MVPTIVPESIVTRGDDNYYVVRVRTSHAPDTSMLLSQLEIESEPRAKPDYKCDIFGSACLSMLDRVLSPAVSKSFPKDQWV